MSPIDLRRTLAQSLVAGLSGPRAEESELSLVAGHGLGGVILFSRNYEDPDQVWELNHCLCSAGRAAGNPPLFVMVDQEGGSVARLTSPFTHAPDLADFAGRSPRSLWAHGRRLGQELRASGFNWNLAPVLDVHALPHGIMARRSLGGDPRQVARQGGAFIAGLQGAGCLACAKHFPGLGRTSLDTHQARPQVDLSRAELEAVELVPFKEAVSQGAAGIMVCHAVFRGLDKESPASLSASVIQGLLRRDLGYQGLVLSDDLAMGALANEMGPAQAAVEAYLAGCDLLLICSQGELALKALDRLVELAQKGRISPQRIQESADRIARVKATLSPLPPARGQLSALLGKKA